VQEEITTTTRRSPVVIAWLVFPLVLAVSGCTPDPADVPPAETAAALDAGGWTTHLEVDDFWPYDCHFSLTDGVEVGASFYPDALEHLIAVGPGVVSFASSPASDGHLTIEVVNAPPAVDVGPYDHVAEASLTTSGTVAVAQVFDYSDRDAEMRPQLRVPPGTYRVRAMFQGLEPVTPDGLDSPAFYRLVLWPDEYRPPAVLKQFRPPGNPERLNAPGC
jgi:hypothetical protein